MQRSLLEPHLAAAEATVKDLRAEAAAGCKFVTLQEKVSSSSASNLQKVLLTVLPHRHVNVGCMLGLMLVLLILWQYTLLGSFSPFEPPSMLAIGSVP